MANIFQNILVSKPRSSVFDLSYPNKVSFDMGALVPIYFENVVPGDKFKVKTEVEMRFAPLVAPVMHQINAYVHYFFVPLRLIWDDFQEFITGGEDGLSQPVFPKHSLFNRDVQIGSLADYLGYNFASVNGTPDTLSFDQYSILPFRAYQFIYNEYYRDQNLTPEVQWSKASGDETTHECLTKGTDFATWQEAMTALTTLRYRAWEKDYFTSALPWVQRGVAAQIPIELNTNYKLVNNQSQSPYISLLGDPITKARRINSPAEAFGDDVYIREDGTLSSNSAPFKLTNSPDGDHIQTILDAHRLTEKFKVVPDADGGGVTAPTINELRLAEHIQKWLEKNARGGARYIEQILSHFGVRVPDYRLDRPEYLGGGKSPVVISDIPQTSSSDATSPQGNLAGQAYSVSNENKFKRSFEEHGFVIGIMSVLPRTCYQQGVSRHLTKFDKFDYYFPEFAHLGEQDVKMSELYNDFGEGGPDTTNHDTFGYQERYAEYKYRSGEVHGDFKQSLDSWHMGRKFSTVPRLNTSFVQSDPTNRIYAVQEGVQHVWCNIYNNVRAVRPMPKHAVPSL